MTFCKPLAVVVGAVLQNCRVSSSISVTAITKRVPRSFVVNAARLSELPTYVEDVQDWLNRENLTYTQLSCQYESSSPNHTLYFLQLKTHQGDPLLLHLLQSPMSIDECMPSGLTQDMTDNGIVLQNAVVSSPIIHLHQDVWCNPRTGPIARSRLLCRLGKVVSRIFARKTVVRRIDGPTATSFLQQHHLWGATKARYSYGLMVKNQTKITSSPTYDSTCSDETLVAVATFSSRRHVQRGAKMHNSHELIRFCSRRDGTVVGGLMKLLAAFVKDCAPDDIVTVIDRDWGVGSTCWHPLGFETVAVMPPLPMVIGATDGTRRHLVGAGIRPETCRKVSAPLLTTRQERIGLPITVLEELAFIYDYDDAINCLSNRGFHPVHDAGVERLLMIIPSKAAEGLQSSVPEIWKSSQPTYAATYYSNNAGINAMLRNADD